MVANGKYQIHERSAMTRKFPGHHTRAGDGNRTSVLSLGSQGTVQSVAPVTVVALSRLRRTPVGTALVTC